MSDPVENLAFDTKKQLLLWKGSVDELQHFCSEQLNIGQLKVSSCDRSTSLKANGVTFTLYKTKTLQVQGAARKEVQAKIKSLLNLDSTIELIHQDPVDFEPSIDLVQNANSEIEAEVNDAETSSNSVIEVHSASPSTDKAYIDVEASTKSS